MQHRKKLAIVCAVFILGVMAIVPSWGQGYRGSDRNAPYGMPGPGMMDGHGMMGGRCPMCGGPWQGPGSWNGSIPKKLPQPKNKQWVKSLQDIFALEKLSQAQYTADENKFRIGMPYMMIIPQEKNHIAWIGGLFSAYQLKSDGKVPAIKKSQSVRQAYEIGLDIEARSIPKYVWLVKNAEDDTTRQVLNTALIQSRMHHMMFTHALEMGGMGMGMRR